MLDYSRSRSSQTKLLNLAKKQSSSIKTLADILNCVAAVDRKIQQLKRALMQWLRYQHLVDRNLWSNLYRAILTITSLDNLNIGLVYLRYQSEVAV